MNTIFFQNIRDKFMHIERFLFYIAGILFLISLAVVRSCVGPIIESNNAINVVDADKANREIAPKSAFQRGMVVGVFPYKDEKPSYRKIFDEMYEYNICSVSLNFNWYMNTIYDPVVFSGVGDENNQTPSDEILSQAIKDAHAAGLKVMLFPSIYILNLSKNEWRGKINPGNWDTWFASYSQLATKLGRLGEKYNAEYYCIGIELISSEKHSENWNSVINDLRKVYRGKLCYSSNWDARKINPWFHNLDMLAMNAYYELTDDKDASTESLISAWKKIKKEISPWRDAFNKELIITEIGYRSADGSITQPWNYYLKGDLDLEEQKRGYEAFFRTWFEEDLFNGVYFYHWFGEGGLKDKSYTPKGKPAGEVMKIWYKKIADRDAKLFADKDKKEEAQENQTKALENDEDSEFEIEEDFSKPNEPIPENFND